MEKIKKIPIIIMASLAVLGTTIFATSGIVNAPSGLVLRGEPSKSGSVITTVKDDATVEVLEESGEWYKVKYNGQEGYLFAKYVEVTEPITPVENTDVNPAENIETNTEQESIQIKNEAKMYMIPLITSTPIKTITAGTTVKIEKEITNWSYVTDGTNEGWVRTYLIKGEQIPVETPEETKPNEEQPQTPEETTNPEEQPETETPAENNTEELPTTVTKGTINVSSANVRKEPSTSSEIVTTLTKGTAVTINAETTEWYKITYTSLNGTVYEGYIFKSLITAN